MRSGAALLDEGGFLMNDLIAIFFGFTIFVLLLCYVPACEHV